MSQLAQGYSRRRSGDTKVQQEKFARVGMELAQPTDFSAHMPREELRVTLTSAHMPRKFIDALVTSPTSPQSRGSR